MVALGVVASSEQLNNAYRKETDAGVKERILLVRRVRIDGLEASKVAERELDKSRWWAYKWLNRFDKHGLDGLKDQPRSGEASIHIRKKDTQDKTGVIRESIWMGGQASHGFDTQKDGCQSTTKYTSIGCYTGGDSHQRFHRRDL